MGVDFYACKACGDTFPDCGSYTDCSEDLRGCGAIYCSDKCGKPKAPEIQDSLDWHEYEKLSESEQAKRRMSCVDCRLELESDENMLRFLLDHIAKSYEQLRSEYREWLKSKGGDPTEP